MCSFMATISSSSVSFEATNFKWGDELQLRRISTEKTNFSCDEFSIEETNFSCDEFSIEETNSAATNFNWGDELQLKRRISIEYLIVLELSLWSCLLGFSKSRSVISRSVMSTCGQEAQYIQDNWPMNQSDCYRQNSLVLKNFVYYIHQTLLPSSLRVLLRVWGTRLNGYYKRSKLLLQVIKKQSQRRPGRR